MAQRSRHTPLEDAQGLVFGTAAAAFALHMLTSAGLMTGQIAGLAVLVSYTTPYSFAEVFFVANIPFYALALWRLGWVFTLKTFLSVALLSGMSLVMPDLIGFDRLEPLAAALLFGILTGFGILALFRHGASLGGIGILGLWLQERFGIRAGWVQLTFDAGLFGVAFYFLDPVLVGVSLAGAVVLNLILAINHRRDRYVA
ncbi:YitT family protein [Rhodobaculum claviforme]|uniref:Membrane protein n=1 Tax=Rhodobaculum claviforme TaxID=1549854 RepID=A0A934THC9_9RHOB|nr:YitT family protein [Rhodobaculum claviforme]MBK5926032.1 membrane protein [Rhodobaculum claviforme]